ncbi:hypothetical protein [Streptomyces sp. NPDC014894]|uniref:hypothetical protein n=1 Tax=Streptomyces sp. NPDC014894 TaxID=3364931 RepID=UPI0036FDB738
MADTGPGVWSGWRSREVRIAGAGAGKPVPLEIRGGFTTMFIVQPVRSGTEGRDTGGFLLTTADRAAQRVVLPPDFDSLLIRRHRGHEGASGFHRWKVRVIPGTALPALSTETAEGEETESFSYSPPAGRPEPALLHYELQGIGHIVYCPSDGAPLESVSVSTHGQRAGTLPLPHRGYVTVLTTERWKVSITP